MVSCSATPAPQTGVAPAPVPAPVQAPAPAPAPASVQAPASAVPTVGEVFDRHAAAVGGRAAWRAHDTRTTTTELRITGGMDQYGNPRDVRGTMIAVRKAPNLLLTTTTIPGIGTIRQGFDGAAGWVSVPKLAVRMLEGSELAELAREAQFDRDLDLRCAYPSAEFVGPFKIRDEMCWKVRLASDDSGTADAFFSQSTGLCVAISRRLLAGGQGMQVTRYLQDYAEFGGIRLPSRTEQAIGESDQVEHLHSVDFGPVDAAIFQQPMVR